MKRKNLMPETGLVCAMKPRETDYLPPFITVGDVTKTASVAPAVTAFPLVFNKIRSVAAFTPIFSVN